MATRHPPTEEGLVLDMVNARWRLNRIQQLITAAIERQMEEAEKEIDDLAEFGDETSEKMSRQTICLEAFAYHKHQRTLETVEHMEARLHRTFNGALRTLRSLQAERAARPPAVVGKGRKQKRTERTHQRTTICAAITYEE